MRKRLFLAQAPHSGCCDCGEGKDLRTALHDNVEHPHSSAATATEPFRSSLCSPSQLARFGPSCVVSQVAVTEGLQVEMEGLCRLRTIEGVAKVQGAVPDTRAVILILRLSTMEVKAS